MEKKKDLTIRALLHHYVYICRGIGLNRTLDLRDTVLRGGALVASNVGAWPSRYPKEVEASSLDLKCSQCVLLYLGINLGRLQVFLRILQRQVKDAKSGEL